MKRFKTFKMSETTFNQIRAMPKETQLKFYTAVCDYGINGVEPKFTGMEYSVWIPMKDLIDYSNERAKVNSSNGSKGGAPEGNNNRNQAKSTEIKQNQPNIFDVIKESAEHGFSIDRKTADDFLGCDLNPSWLMSPYSFIEFVAERINEKYDDKPDGDKKALFISAVKEWGDLREEYRTALEKRRAKIAKTEARNNVPTKCPFCGGTDLRKHGDYQCKGCSAVCSFNEKTLTWEWRQ